jgi:hypothetical protein
MWCDAKTRPQVWCLAAASAVTVSNRHRIDPLLANGAIVNAPAAT